LQVLAHFGHVAGRAVDGGFAPAHLGAVAEHLDARGLADRRRRSTR
jgi:hypothetical protein